MEKLTGLLDGLLHTTDAYSNTAMSWFFFSMAICNAVLPSCNQTAHSGEALAKQTQ